MQVRLRCRDSKPSIDHGLAGRDLPQKIQRHQESMCTLNQIPNLGTCKGRRSKRMFFSKGAYSKSFDPLIQRPRQSPDP